MTVLVVVRYGGGADTYNVLLMDGEAELKTLQPLHYHFFSYILKTPWPLPTRVHAFQKSLFCCLKQFMLISFVVFQRANFSIPF